MTDIASIMSDDPLNLTKDKLDELIANLRANRHQFNMGVRAKPKAKVKKKLADELDLKGIDL